MKLKTCVIGAALLLTATLGYSQKASDKVVQYICDCVERKIPTVLAELHLRDSVNACLGQGITIDRDGLWKEYKLKKGTTVELIREVGRRLWQKSEAECEKFREVAAEIRRSDG